MGLNIVKKRPLSEKKIQGDILKFLALVKNKYKLFYYRQNGGSIKTDKTYFKCASINGLSDIVVVKDGIYIGLEIKSQKGIQSNHQKDVERGLTVAGGLYFVVRSVADVKKALGV